MFKGQWGSVAIAAVVLLAFCFAFGGASRAHELRLALVELAALPLLALAALQLIGDAKTAPNAHGAWPTHRFFLLLLAGLFLIPLLQLIPLPPNLWTALPGREQARLGLEVAGIRPGWSGLSLTPDLTWRSLLALIPPAAMALGVLAGGETLARRLVVGVLAGTVAAIVLGALQISGVSRMHLWGAPDYGVAMTGVFANRNHMAALCLIAMPFAAVLGAQALRRNRDGRGRGLAPWIFMSIAGLIVVSLGVILSRAGVILGVPVLGASLLACWLILGRGRRPGWAALGVAAAVTLPVAAVALFAVDPILARLTGQADGRSQFWPTVIEAAQAYLPLGSGVGSFDAVYRSVETLEELAPTYLNHAHNDYLEIWLETGWMGVGLLIAFMVWFARRAWTAWRRPAGGLADLQRAATIGMTAILLHSIGDYPLRTTVLAVIFALLATLLELKPVEARSTRR